MKINSIQFNFIYPRPQNTVTSPLRMKNEIQSDTVSFSGVRKKNLEDLVPKHKGIVYKKVTDENGNVIKKIPVEVDIEKWGGGEFQFKIGEECIGYVQLAYIPEESCNKNSWAELNNDYKEEGVVGDRLKVIYLENNNQDEYGGIGHLADLLEVAACKEMGFEPNIVSFL